MGQAWRTRHRQGGRAFDSQRLALTRIELIVIMLCTFALLAVAVIILYRVRTGPTAITLSMRDAQNLRQVHQGMILAADEQRGWYPRPGMIRRHPIEVAGELQFVSGRGEPDPSQDTTANLYSVMVMNQYIGTNDLISPGELNPVINVMHGYDYDAYQPERGMHWDSRFRADLETGSHVSYAHMLLFGERMHLHWRSTASRHIPLLGSRGPRDGVPDPDSHTCDRHGRWEGVTINNDNQYEFLDTMTPAGLSFLFEGERRTDNIFNVDDGKGGRDVILTFTRAISQESIPNIQHD